MLFYFPCSAQRYAQKQTDSLICIGHSSAGLKGQRLKVHMYLNAITSCQVSSVNTLTYGLVPGGYLRICSLGVVAMETQLQHGFILTENN